MTLTLTRFAGEGTICESALTYFKDAVIPLDV